VFLVVKVRLGFSFVSSFTEPAYENAEEKWKGGMRGEREEWWVLDGEKLKLTKTCRGCIGCF
jgi:hypothetical protein